MVGRGERDREGGSCFTFDFLLNGNAEDVDREFEAGLLVSEGQGAVGLPWPVGVVEDLNLDDLSHTRNNLDDIFGFALANGTSLFPALLAFKVPVLVSMVTMVALAPVLLELLSALGSLLLPLLWGPVLAFTTAKLLHEVANHVLQGTTAATAAAASTTSSTEATASTTGSSTECIHHLANELHGVLALVLALGFFLFVFLLFFFIGNDNHDVRSAARLSDFDKGVFMALAFLTRGTDVVVLADGALVADSTDGVHATAIALNTLVNSLSLLRGHVDVTKVCRLHQFFENILSLLVELIIYEVLNRFSWDTFLFLGLLFALGRCSGLLHLLIDFHCGSCGSCGCEGADLGS